MDLQSLDKWVDYSIVKDRMFKYTDIEESPWYVVPSDIKKHARLNCISHLLDQIPYDRNLKPEPIDWPEDINHRDTVGDYKKRGKDTQKIIPDIVVPFLEMDDTPSGYSEYHPKPIYKAKDISNLHGFLRAYKMWFLNLVPKGTKYNPSIYTDCLVKVGSEDLDFSI